MLLTEILISGVDFDQLRRENLDKDAVDFDQLREENRNKVDFDQLAARTSTKTLSILTNYVGRTWTRMPPPRFSSVAWTSTSCVAKIWTKTLSILTNCVAKTWIKTRSPRHPVLPDRDDPHG
jgi:hypothetical protein